MGAFPILSELTSVTQHATSPVVALGQLEAKRNTKDSILRTLASSLFGTLATSLFWKEESRYVALHDGGVSLLVFRGTKLSSTTHYASSELQNRSSAVDDQFVSLSFDRDGQHISWKLMRNQIVEPDGSYLSDPAQLKQVMEMTAFIAQQFH